MIRRVCSAVAAAGLVAAVASSAHADDIRWAPWLGCWDMLRENVSEGRAIPGFTDPAPPSGLPQRGSPRVCVEATGASGATLTTTVEGQPALQQTITADGSAAPIRDDSCTGTQRAEWSTNGQRLFANAELACGSDKAARTVSGLSLIAPDGTWLDIRTVRMGRNESTRVSRYRRPAGQGAPRPGSRMTVGDVKEASGKVSPRVVEAALVETNAGFDLSSRDLIDLTDAKLAPNVIDLMIALSYPQRFVVERTARGGSAGFGPFSGDPFFGSSALSPFGLFDPFDDYLYPAYFYSPFAYSYLGRFDPWYFGSSYYGVGGGVIGGGGSGNGDGGGGGGAPQASGAGRFVDGVGYTRVRPREAEPQAASNNGGRPGTVSTSSSSGSSGGGSVSPQGYSGGSSSGSSGGGDGGRTAQPR